MGYQGRSRRLRCSQRAYSGNNLVRILQRVCRQGEIYDNEDHPDPHFVATDNDHFMIRTWGRGTRRVDGIK